MYDGSLPFPPCNEKYKVFVFEEIGNIGSTNLETPCEPIIPSIINLEFKDFFDSKTIIKINFEDCAIKDVNYFSFGNRVFIRQENNFFDLMQIFYEHDPLHLKKD